MTEITTTPAPGLTTIDQGAVKIAYCAGIEFGNMDARPAFDTSQNAANRERFVRCLPASKYVLQKVRGGAEIADISDMSFDSFETLYPADGLVTTEKGVALGCNPADCDVMTVSDAQGTALGLAHAGRSGVELGIHLRIIKLLGERYNMAPESLRVVFGPSISQESYHFPYKDIPSTQLEDPRWKEFIDIRNNHCYINILGRIIKEVTDIGVNPANIEVSNIDTYSNPAYFSHVRSARTNEFEGRNGHAAVLVPEA